MIEPDMSRPPMWMLFLSAICAFVLGMFIQHTRQIDNECEARSCPGGRASVVNSVCSCITPAPKTTRDGGS